MDMDNDRSEKLKNMRLLRRSSRCTQQTLAGALHVSRSTISMWENGSNEPDIRQIVEIARFFCVSIDYLLGYENREEERLTEQETQWLSFYRALDGSDQTLVLKFMQFVVSQHHLC